MTQEEKARAYDEALAKCKAYIEDTKKRWSEEFCKATEKVFEEIFPQLKESEDERMLREIKQYIKEQGDKPTGLPNGTVAVADMLAYLEKQLEKQKEQKPVDLSEMMVHKEPYIAPVPTPMVAGEQKPAEWSNADYEARNEIMILLIHSGKTPLASWFSKAFPFDRKQEWSKEDEQLLKSIIDLVGGAGSQPLGLRGKQIPWLKALPNRFNLKPKQEWSEEDKEALDMCLDAIPKRWKTKSGILLTNWLKEHLRQQPVPIWSEKDEEMLQSIIKDFRAGKVSTIGQEQWLKSLRSQPKRDCKESLENQEK